MSTPRNELQSPDSEPVGQKSRLEQAEQTRAEPGQVLCHGDSNEAESAETRLDDQNTEDEQTILDEGRLDALADATGFLLVAQDEECDHQMSAAGTIPGASVIESGLVRIPQPSAVPSVASEADPWLGAQINGYQLMEKIGQGGEGIVYQAQQRYPVNRMVAIKFLNTGLSHDSRRMETEKRTLAALDHPNIVPIYDAGTWNSKIPYFVMKYVNGIRIDKWAKESKASTVDIAALMLQVARAIAYAHSRGIIHRDLKPGNLLVVLRNPNRNARDEKKHFEQPPTDLQKKGKIREEEIVRRIGEDCLPPLGRSSTLPSQEAKAPIPDVLVTDFGLAKIMADQGDQSITDSATMLGTIGYLSPEQARVESALLDQPTVDVYGFGATLYRLLTGRTPSRTGNWGVCLEDLKHHAPRSTRHFNPDVPRDLDSICMKCLEKKPSARYMSMDELAVDLQRFLTGNPVSARPLGSISKLGRNARRQPILYSLSAALLLSLIGTAISFWWLWQNSASSRRQVSRNLELALNILKEEQEDAESMLSQVSGVMEYRIKRLDASIALLQRIVSENPFETFPRRRLAVAYYLRGSIPLHHGRSKQRQQDFLEAKRIFEELSVIDPTDNSLRFDIFHCLYAYPHGTPDPENESEADYIYSLEALATIESLVMQFPDNDIYLDAYAAALCRVAGIYDRDQNEKIQYAKSLTEKALSIAKALSERHPDKPRYLRHIINASRQMGSFSRRLAEYREDISYIYDALDAAERLNLHEPNEPTNLILLAQTHSSIAILEFGRGNHDLAEQHQATAVRLMEDGRQAFPDYSALELVAADVKRWFEEAQRK